MPEWANGVTYCERDEFSLCHFEDCWVIESANIFNVLDHHKKVCAKDIHYANYAVDCTNMNFFLFCVKLKIIIDDLHLRVASVNYDGFKTLCDKFIRTNLNTETVKAIQAYVKVCLGDVEI